MSFNIYNLLIVLCFPDIVVYSHLCQQLLKKCMHVPIHNANANKVLSDSHNCFTFGSYNLF